MEKIGLHQIHSRRIYLKFRKKVSYVVLNLIKKSNLVLDREIKDQLYRFQKDKMVSILFVKKISRLLDLEFKFFEENIELITSCKNTHVGIKNPKFPIDFASISGVRLISAIMGDGEINKQVNARYNNQEKLLVELVLNSFKRVFGEVDYKIYLRSDRTYQLHFPKIVGLILLEIGFKPGYKTITNYGIPKFVFNLNTNLKSVFVRQFFNDEGNVRLKDRRLQVKQTLKATVYKSELKSYPEKYAPKSLQGIQRLLSEIGITSKISLGCYRVTDERADWELSCYGIENLKKFKKYIGFDLGYKNKLLENSIKSYKFPSAPRNGRMGYALEKFRSVQEHYGFVTKYLLARESRRSIKTTVKYLIDLKGKGIIQDIERPRDKKGHPQARKYCLV